MKLELMYTKPATTFNRELLAKYEKNIFSVMEEVWASDDERVDLVIFLNGLAIMSFELKCNAAGPVSYTHLDVYKRQPLYQSGHKGLREMFFFIGWISFRKVKWWVSR